MPDSGELGEQVTRPETGLGVLALSHARIREHLPDPQEGHTTSLERSTA